MASVNQTGEWTILQGKGSEELQWEYSKNQLQRFCHKFCISKKGNVKELADRLVDTIKKSNETNNPATSDLKREEERKNDTDNTYEGECKNNCREGKRSYSNGDAYEGEWKNDRREGRGKMIYADGDIYEGEWKNDLKEGQGTMTYVDEEWESDNSETDVSEEIYEGEWKNDRREGYGKMIYADRGVYEGEWKNDIREGKGKMIYNNKDIYEGEWRNDIREGRGKMIYDSKDIYEGEWKKSMRRGEGKMTFANGDINDGEWKNNKIHGKGRMIYVNGDIYDGEWRYGQFIGGKGAFPFADSSRNSKTKKPIDVNDNSHSEQPQEIPSLHAILAPVADVGEMLYYHRYFKDDLENYISEFESMLKEFILSGLLKKNSEDMHDAIFSVIDISKIMIKEKDKSIPNLCNEFLDFFAEYSVAESKLERTPPTKNEHLKQEIEANFHNMQELAKKITKNVREYREALVKSKNRNVHEEIQKAINLGADVNEKDESGNTPLMIMIKKCLPRCIGTLFQNAFEEIDLKHCNSDYLTADALIKQQPKPINDEVYVDDENCYKDGVEKHLQTEYAETKRVYNVQSKIYKNKMSEIRKNPAYSDREKCKTNNVSPEIRRSIWNSFHGTDEEAYCIICHRTIYLVTSEWNCAHIIARANNGATDPFNLIPTCGNCNNKMNTKSALIWTLSGNWHRYLPDKQANIDYEDRLLQVCQKIFCVHEQKYGNIQMSLHEYITSKFCFSHDDKREILRVLKNANLNTRMNKLADDVELTLKRAKKGDKNTSDKKKRKFNDETTNH